MPEQHAEVGAVVVRRNHKAAIHVGVAARLVAEKPTDPIDLLRARGVLTPRADRHTGNVECGGIDDPKRLTGRVVVSRPDLHAPQSLASGPPRRRWRRSPMSSVRAADGLADEVIG